MASPVDIILVDEIYSASVVHRNDVGSNGENPIPTFAIPQSTFSLALAFVLSRHSTIIDRITYCWWRRCQPQRPQHQSRYHHSRTIRQQSAYVITDKAVPSAARTQVIIYDDCRWPSHHELYHQSRGSTVTQAAPHADAFFALSHHRRSGKGSVGKR